MLKILLFILANGHPVYSLGGLETFASIPFLCLLCLFIPVIFLSNFIFKVTQNTEFKNAYNNFLSSVANILEVLYDLENLNQGLSSSAMIIHPLQVKYHFIETCDNTKCHRLRQLRVRRLPLAVRGCGSCAGQPAGQEVESIQKHPHKYTS